MGAFDLEHLPFNRGWRWKIEQTSDNFTLEPGEDRVIHELNLEDTDEDVIAGWIVYAQVSSTSDQITFDSVTELPGPEGKRRAGGFKAEDLIAGGATDPRTALPWAEQTAVDGVDVYSIWVNAFGGFAIPVRFPEFSRLVVSNPADNDSDITVTGYNSASLLVHEPEDFFRQMRAYKALSGEIKLEASTVEEAREELMIDGDIEELLLDILTEDTT